ncbi:MAG: hypothetical protein HQK65_22990, partial [Desulfamplus sp.]|nr:hypothetical protein [Desulfamplus sp.]
IASCGTSAAFGADQDSSNDCQGSEGLQSEAFLSHGSGAGGQCEPAERGVVEECPLSIIRKVMSHRRSLNHYSEE